MTPGLARRMACFVYEGLVLFGLTLVPGLVGAIVLPRDATPSWIGATALRAFAFALYGVYFVGFWTRRGQTLPMQTWRIRLETRDGSPLTTGRAVLRYACAWAWIVPAVIVAWRLGTRPAASLALVGAWIVMYAALSRLAPERQFWHDVLCGTRLRSVPPVARG